MNCPNCGNTIPAEKYCVYCGHEIQHEIQKDTSQNSNIWLWGIPAGCIVITLIFAVVIAVIIFANSYFSSSLSSSPVVAIHPYDPDQDINAECVTCRIENWTGSITPGYRQWNVDFPSNVSALLTLGWCAIDKTTLDSNWSSLAFELAIDEEPISLTNLKFSEGEIDNGVCYFYDGVVNDWSSGTHTYTWTLHIYQTLTDGWDTYSKGDYVDHYIVSIR